MTSNILSDKPHISKMGIPSEAYAIFARSGSSSAVTLDRFMKNQDLWHWGVAKNNIELQNLTRNVGIPDFNVTTKNYPVDLVFGFEPETNAVIFTGPIPLRWSINQWLSTLRSHSNSDKTRLIIGSAISPIILTLLHYRNPDAYNKGIKRLKLSKQEFWVNQNQLLLRVINQDIAIDTFPIGINQPLHSID